jgi:hypothetical protein
MSSSLTPVPPAHAPGRAGYACAVVDQAAMREVLVEVAVALKESGLPFALTGGYAAWAHGGPEPDHDVDFLVRPEDSDKAAEALAERGFLVTDPVEDWLFKVHVRDVVVDVLHRTNHQTPDQAIRRSGPIQVASVEVPVLAATDVVAEQLLALDERYCDYAGIIPTLRALREKLDWTELARRADGQPFAEAALFLADRLRLAPGADGDDASRR